MELPAPCNLLRERGRRSQGEGNTQQGGSSREQRPFTLTHTHLHANTHMNTLRHTHAGSGCVATGEREGRRHSEREADRGDPQQTEVRERKDRTHQPEECVCVFVSVCVCSGENTVYAPVYVLEEQTCMFAPRRKDSQ